MNRSVRYFAAGTLIRDNARNNARCRRGRPHKAWMDNIKTWTGLSVVESIRMTEDRDKWRKYVHGVANRRIARTAKEQYTWSVSEQCSHSTFSSSFQRRIGYFHAIRFNGRPMVHPHATPARKNYTNPSVKKQTKTTTLWFKKTGPLQNFQITSTNIGQY